MVWLCFWSTETSDRTRCNECSPRYLWRSVIAVPFSISWNYLNAPWDPIPKWQSPRVCCKQIISSRALSWQPDEENTHKKTSIGKTRALCIWIRGRWQILLQRRIANAMSRPPSAVRRPLLPTWSTDSFIATHFVKKQSVALIKLKWSHSILSNYNSKGEMNNNNPLKYPGI
jgi:hypothetical protein